VFFILVVIVNAAGSYVIDTTGDYSRRFDGIGSGGQLTEGTEHCHMNNETEENYERGSE